MSTSPVVVDTSCNVAGHAKALFDSGVRAVIRYYTSNMDSGKLLRPAEVRAIGEAGLGIGAVYQVAQNKRKCFDRDQGARAGQTAWSYAHETIGQPAGSAIYFAVDYDASTSDVEEVIIPYFEAARAELRPGDLMRSYRIGAYGSGRVCGTLLDRGLVDLVWLAGATGWAGYGGLHDSKRWALCQHLPTKIAGVSVDPDDVQPGWVDFGQFTAPAAPDPVTVRTVGTYRVTATALNVRSAPDPKAKKLGSLAKGETIEVVGFAGDAYGWAAIASTQQPGITGYSSAKYLVPVT